MTRKFLMPLAELIERLIIDQIKEVKIPAKRESLATEFAILYHDIDLILKQRAISATAEILAISTNLVVINYEIWSLKDNMTAGIGDYAAQLKLAHQLNGIRNQLKNKLMFLCGDMLSNNKTNINTDELQGWDLFINSLL